MLPIVNSQNTTIAIWPSIKYEVKYEILFGLTDIKRTLKSRTRKNDDPKNDHMISFSYQMIFFIETVSCESANLSQDKDVSMELQISYKSCYIRRLL